MNLLQKGEKLLLHQCCGPCSMWPLHELTRQGVDVTLLYFNPNIHPYAEWERRMESARKAAAHFGVSLIIEMLYLPNEWRKRAKDGIQRCHFCYRTRLQKAAAIARELHIDNVSTTLLVSPYQKRDAILEEGARACEEEGVNFIPFDWRDGFRKGQAMAREIGLYRQKYCGCVVSLESSEFFAKIGRDHDVLTFRDMLEHCDRSRLLSDGVFT